MASSLISKIVPGGSSDSAIEEEMRHGQKYLLSVTAGSSYDSTTHKTVAVNTEQTTTVENQFVTATIKVRIRNYDGLPTGSPGDCAYFDDPEHSKDQYSFAFSFVPKSDIKSEHAVWGVDFDHSIKSRLPPGTSTAIKIVKEFIDPGLTADPYSEKPWILGPALSSWFAFRIGPMEDEQSRSDLASAPVLLQEGADGSGTMQRRHAELPDDASKRRKFFLSADNRAKFTFEKGRLYHGDFYNGYLDFNRNGTQTIQSAELTSAHLGFALVLPGFSVSALKYIDSKTHQLRWVFKDKETDELYFCIVLTLLFGEQLDQALAVDKSTSGRQQERPDHDQDNHQTRRQSRSPVHRDEPPAPHSAEPGGFLERAAVTNGSPSPSTAQDLVQNTAPDTDGDNKIRQGDLQREMVQRQDSRTGKVEAFTNAGTSFEPNGNAAAESET